MALLPYKQWRKWRLLAVHQRAWMRLEHPNTSCHTTCVLVFLNVENDSLEMWKRMCPSLSRKAWYPSLQQGVTAPHMGAGRSFMRARDLDLQSWDLGYPMIVKGGIIKSTHYCGLSDTDKMTILFLFWFSHKSSVNDVSCCRRVKLKVGFDSKMLHLSWQQAEPEPEINEPIIQINKCFFFFSIWNQAQSKEQST